MKIKNNQSGIAHVAAVLLVVIIAAIGVVGWKVWDSEHNKKQKDDNTSQVTASKSSSGLETKKDISDAVPAGFTKFENKDLGFSFAYPKDWGTASTSTKNAGRLDIAFASSSGQVAQYSVTLHSKDAPHLDTDSSTLNIRSLNISGKTVSVDDTSVAETNIFSSGSDYVVYKVEGNIADDFVVLGIRNLSKVTGYDIAIVSNSASTSSSSDQKQSSELIGQVIATFQET